VCHHLWQSASCDSLPSFGPPCTYVFVFSVCRDVCRGPVHEMGRVVFISRGCLPHVHDAFAYCVTDSPHCDPQTLTL